jgi:hypothetical protein
MKITLALLSIFLCLWLRDASVSASETDQSSIAGGVLDARLCDEKGVPKAGEDAKIIDLDDRLVVSVQDLDGYLYDQVAEGHLPEDEWFDGDVMKLITKTSLADLFDASKDPADEASMAIRREARHGVNTMTRQVQEYLYLQLGPARLRHIRPEDPFVTQDDKGVFTFVFVVRNSGEDEDEWAKLRNIHGETRPVSITLGFDYKDVAHSLPTKLETTGVDLQGNAAEGFRYRIYSPRAAAIFGVVYVLVVVAFIFFSGLPNLLRDPDGPLRGDRRVFSLSRIQLAWWFFIVLGAWLFLWIITGTLDTLNQTALTVAGIGSLTALGGAVAGKVNQSLSAANVAGNTLTVDMSKRPPLFRHGPGAVLYDILSDVNTLGFHRFQLLVWNFILGIVFLSEVWDNFSMPTFDSTVLGLLGISAATYAGFKMTPTKDS